MLPLEIITNSQIVYRIYLCLLGAGDEGWTRGSWTGRDGDGGRRVGLDLGGEIGILDGSGEGKESIGRSTKSRIELRVKIPRIYELANTQLPKQLLTQLSKHNPPTSPQLTVSTLHPNLNPYHKQSQMHYLLHTHTTTNQTHTLSVSAQLIEVLCGCSEEHCLRKLSYFSNYRQYVGYFCGSGRQGERVVLFGLYHVEDGRGFIDMLEFRLYALVNQQWTLLQSHKLQPIYKPNQTTKSQHNPQPETNTLNLTNVAKTDLNPSSSTLIPAPLYSQKWQSMLDLQYKLKHLTRKLAHNYHTPYNQHPLQTQPQPQHPQHPQYRHHYLLEFVVGECQLYMIVVYNNQTLMEDAIGYCFGSGRGRRSMGMMEMGMERSQWGVLEEKYRGLCRIYRLRYPWRYYLELAKKYYLVMEELWEGHGDSHGLGQLRQADIMLLCKYMLVQNITNIRQLYTPTNIIPYYTKPPTTNPTIPSRLRPQKILTLPYKSLSQNPTTPSLILYWLVSPPGTYKTQILKQIHQILEEYGVDVLYVEEEDVGIVGEKVGEFCRWRERRMGKEGMGRMEGMEEMGDRCGFCLLDVWFGVNRLEEVVAMLGRVVGDNTYYQLCLVTTDMTQTTTFISQISNSQPQQQPPSTIPTTYKFSTQYLLCSLLTIQTRPCPSPSSSSPNTLYNQSTKSLSKALHYISSTYTNLDLPKLLSNLDIYGGEVRIIQYGSTDRMVVRWDCVEEEDRDQVVDQLRVLLGMSYKRVIQEDVMLAYFLANLGELDFGVDVKGIGGIVVDATFNQLPFYQSQ